MRLDVLKIDQSFVFDLPNNSEACTMANACITGSEFIEHWENTHEI